MKTKYLVIVVLLIALVSSLWAEEPEDTPVSFFGIAMGECIPQDAVAKKSIKVPKGFDGISVTVSPLTRRVTAVTVTKKLGSEDKATRWVDTLVSGLALSTNAQLVYANHLYTFAKGRLNVTACQIGSEVYLRVSDASNDGIHAVIEEAREWRGAPMSLSAERPEEPAKKPAKKQAKTPAKK